MRWLLPVLRVAVVMLQDLPCLAVFTAAGRISTRCFRNPKSIPGVFSPNDSITLETFAAGAIRPPHTIENSPVTRDSADVSRDGAFHLFAVCALARRACRRHFFHYTISHRLPAWLLIFLWRYNRLLCCQPLGRCPRLFAFTAHK